MILHRLRIVQDSDTESPLDNETLGRIVCWHRRLNLGHKHKHLTPGDFNEDMDDGCYVKLPVYMYEHGGIALSTSPFSCMWDSGQVGYIYCEEPIAGMTREQVVAALKSEVETYGSWLAGECYGFELEQSEMPPETTVIEDMDTDDLDWEHSDSCYGFIGDPEKSGMDEHINPDLKPLFEEACRNIGEWVISREPAHV